MDAEVFEREFRRRYGKQPIIVSAPGRVNLIGEHTDYNEGFVLPFAIDRQTLVGIAGRPDNWINAHTITLNKSAKFEARAFPRPEKNDWTTYIAGMVEVLIRQGQAVAGADILIDSDIPFGSGLSSSAALEIGIGLALSELAGRHIDLRELAYAGQTVEHEFAGVRSGIMDQLASGLSRAENVMLIDCRTMELQYVPFKPAKEILVVCDSRVRHSLAASAYNERRLECEKALELLAAKIPDLKSLRDLTLDAFEEFKACLPDLIERRCKHVVTENERTLQTAAALRRLDLHEVGRLMDLSHESLRDDYEVSCRELDLLAGTAIEMQQVYGARMTGGGFGGCTINLLEALAFGEFKERITEAFGQAFGHSPVVFPVTPSAGARRIK